MRTIETHKVNPANDTLTITVLDQPGAGGANHLYQITGFTAGQNGFMLVNPLIAFQNGPIPEAGVNGLTNEILLALVADRLASFQAGPFACEENAEALLHVKAAAEVLKERTLKRMSRGVEGTLKV